MYSDVKRTRRQRLTVLGAVAVVLCVTSLAGVTSLPVGIVAGLLVLVVNLLVGARERRLVAKAVATKEKFDTTVFQLPPNDHLGLQMPSHHEVVLFAERYDQHRDENWYGNTLDVIRPFDVLICLREDAAWGAPVHRAWAAVVAAAAAAAAIAVALLWWALGIGPGAGAAAFAAPSVALVAEAIQTAQGHLTSARTKENSLQLTLHAWADGLRTGSLSVKRCRQIQDANAQHRLSNAHVPDWFDNRRRPQNETAMRMSTADMVDEARAAGLSATGRQHRP